MPVENTAIRLEPYPPTGQLLMTSEDGFAVRLVNMKSHAKTKNFVPTQLGPIAIASDAKQVCVLNYLSSTLTVADGKLFGTSTFPWPRSPRTARRPSRPTTTCSPASSST